MIRVVHPGSGCRLSPIPDPGSMGRKGTQSRIRIRNTASHGGRLGGTVEVPPKKISVLTVGKEELAEMPSQLRYFPRDFSHPYPLCYLPDEINR
jgi:hypothetical protein